MLAPAFLDFYMRTFRFDKLVRDNIVSNMLREGCRVDWRVLKDEEYYHELLHKFSEELIEAREAGTAEEAADIMEVSRAFVSEFGSDSMEYGQLMSEFHDFLAHNPNITEERIEIARVKKMNKLGGFSSRQYITTVGITDESQWIEYYERTYQEVK